MVLILSLEFYKVPPMVMVTKICWGLGENKSESSWESVLLRPSPLSESVIAPLCMCVVNGGCCLWSQKERKSLDSLSGTPPEPRLLCPSAPEPMAQQGERTQLKKAGRAAICHSTRGEHNHGHISMINDLFWRGECLWIPLLLFLLLAP